MCGRKGDARGMNTAKQGQEMLVNGQFIAIASSRHSTESQHNIPRSTRRWPEANRGPQLQGIRTAPKQIDQLNGNGAVEFWKLLRGRGAPDWSFAPS